MLSMWDHYEEVPDKPLNSLYNCFKKDYSRKYHDSMNSVRDAASVNCKNTTKHSSPSTLLRVPAEPAAGMLTRKRQQVINDNKPRKMQKKRKAEVDKKLFQMLIQEYQPISIVANEGFRSFVQELNPNYELPNQTFISDTFIPEQFKECKTIVMNLVQKAKQVCISIECWQSVILDNYLSVTAHFILDYEQQTVLLHCEQISASHAAEDLAKCLKNITQEFKIDDKISLVTSNNNQIRTAAHINHWPSFECFIHKLDSVILNAIDEIDFILEIVINVIFHFENSDVAEKALRKYQIDHEKQAEAFKLIQSVPTRWNSVFNMLQRFMKLQHALNAVIIKLKLDLPDIPKEIWDTIKQVCMILQPFEEASKAMTSTRYLTASMAVVIADGLKNVINVMKDKQMTDVSKTFLSKLDDGLNMNFPESDIGIMLLGLCTFMDPRFKIHAFLDHTGDEAASAELSRRHKCANFIQEHILNQVKIKIRNNQSSLHNSGDSVDKGSESSDEESEPISLWGKIDKNIAATVPVLDEISMKAAKELEMFLNEEVVRRDCNPLSWWKRHASLYPHLAEVFTDHCHNVVSAVPCDRAISKAENILMEKRARLDRKGTAEIVFLNNNSSLCN